MGFFGRLKKGLSKSRGNLTERVDELVENTAVVDDDFYEELEDGIRSIITRRLGNEFSASGAAW